MVSVSLNKVNIALRMVRTGPKNRAKGSGMSGGKRAASLSPPKPRISANLDGRQSGPGRGVQNEPDITAGATSDSAKPPVTRKKTQSSVKAANEAAEATNVPNGVSGRGGKTPMSPAGQSVTPGATSLVQACLQGAVDKPGQPPEQANVRRAKSCRQADSDESEDASTECKEAKGTWGSIFNDNNEHEEDDKDAEDDEESEGKASSDDPDDEEDPEFALLRWEMDALEHCMYSKGTMASVFARTVTQARLAGKTFGDNAVAAMAAIFEGSENPNPCAVAAVLEPDAASARAYLVIMNGKVGFTLLHHLQRVDREIWPGDLIANQIVAFEGDIQPQGPTLNVVVFNKAKDTLFQQFNLPRARLVETNTRYSLRANRNNQSLTFVVDPSVTARVTGAVTRMIPIPMEWAPIIVYGPNFGAGCSTCSTHSTRMTGPACIPSWR
jgi:hypothetical protein